MNVSCSVPEVRIFIRKGEQLKLRHPDNAHVERDISPPHGRRVRLIGVETDVRGWPWVVFPEYGNLGLPLLSRNDKHVSIRSHWDNAVIDAWRVWSRHKRRALFDD